ncbi:MAG: hypothetical protein PW788_12905 [Micavibrio sp.]|nr:hypothetical protein [Micavibrio sp.]
MDIKSYLRSFGIGLFYALYIYTIDRVVHIGGVVNGIFALLFSLAATMIAVGTFKVHRESKYYLPMKYSALFVGVVVGVLLVYAFFGTMKGRDNFIQTIAAIPALPAPVHKVLDSYVAFGKAHCVPWPPQPKPLPAPATTP